MLSSCRSLISRMPGLVRYASVTPVVKIRPELPACEAWVFSLDSEKPKEIVQIPSDLFGREPRPDILQRMVRWQLAKKRGMSTSKTKGRAEVRGGGKKPFAQKGTGRARQGSIRSPLHRGGGHVFPKKPRDFSYQLNKKVRQLALKIALSTRYKEGNLIVLDHAKLETHKTKDMDKLRSKLSLYHTMIIDGNELDKNAELAIRNIPDLHLTPCKSANVYDILKNKKLVITVDGIKGLQNRLSAA